MAIAKNILKRLHNLFSSCAPLFIALGDEARQKLILDIADAGENGINVMGLTAKSHLSRPAVSHHLKILKDTGFVSTVKNGTQIFYKINLEKNLKKIQEFILSIQSVVEKVKESQDEIINLENHSVSENDDSEE